MKAREQVLSAGPEAEGERGRAADFVRLMDADASAFRRDRLEGHFTSSAWVSSVDGHSACFVLHRKLGRWVQPGGHCDGVQDFLEVALAELEQETALSSASLVLDRPYDLEVFDAPALGQVPAHLHYDVCWLLVATPSETPRGAPEEASDARWFTLEEVEASPLTDFDAETRRRFRKAAGLMASLAVPGP